MGWKFRPKRNNPYEIEINCKIPKGRHGKLEKISRLPMPLASKVRAFKEAGASEIRVSRNSRRVQGQSGAETDGKHRFRCFPMAYKRMGAQL